MPSWWDMVSGKSQESDLPILENEYFRKIENIPPAERTIFRLRQEAEAVGLPNPPAAALEMQKIIKSDLSLQKEMMPPQPAGTTQLDVPLAQTIRSILPELDYLQAAPIQAPLGMQGELPMTIQDLISSLPSDYQLPSPIQGQQPELSVF